MILPKDFENRMEHLLGEEYAGFLKSLDEPPPVSVRINSSKRIHDFDTLEKVPWATNSFYLPQRISFTLDPLFHAGCYYVQEPSSMILEQVIGQIAGNAKDLRVLDLCAAPGGKSTHILSTLPSDCLLVSNEIISSRNKILQHNIIKWGYSNVIVSQNEAAAFSALPGFFDVIVVDAPCSGEGLFRKQPGAVYEWSEGAVSHCAFRQKEILDAVYPSLKEGGFLIYSTCTFEPDENENQVKYMVDRYEMKAHPLNLPFPGLVQNELGTRFYPHRISGEGFFISVMQKMEAADQPGNSKKEKPMKNPEFFNELLSGPDAYTAFKRENDWYAIPSGAYEDFNRIRDKLYVRKAGIYMGTMKRADFIPSHDLGLSSHLNKNVKRFEMTREDAIEFLKCNVPAIKIPPNGWYAVTFRDFVLGWMKSVGSRVNNYFPKEYRILKDQFNE